MLRPVIFIGCGGSGAKAVRYVRSAVKRTLDQAAWQHGMPDSWQFIGLDTLTTQENPTEIPTIPGNDFLTLSAEFDAYAALHRSLVAGHSGHRGDPELLCGWLPDPDEVNVPLKDGAGQVRAIGRAVGLRSLERTLKPRLEEAFRRAKSGNAELYAVGQCLGLDAELGSETPEPLVVVCSSMAGGTGAGVALDVVDLLRRSDPLGNYPTLVLFANDIFDFQAKTDSMTANSLGLISEMLAAYWAKPDEIESPLATSNVQDEGVGPHSAFILGKAGYSGADLGNTQEFYRAVGEALSSWVTSNTVQEQIHNFINVNWQANASQNYGGYPFGREQQLGALSSFGAAKLTVGRERFAQWAKHQLGKQILEGLIQGHLRLAGDLPDGLSDERKVEEAGKNYAEMVYQAWPRWEAGPEQCPGLKGARTQFASDEQLRETMSRLKREIKQDLPSGQEASGEQWRGQLERSGRRRVEEVERTTRELSARDQAWCQDMVHATCSAASQVAAVQSMPVAVAAVTEAATRLNREEVTKLRAAASGDSAEYSKRVAEGLATIARISGKVSSDDPRLDEAVTSLAQGIALHWRNLRLTRAAEVLEHAETQLLESIADSFRAASGQVGEAYQSDEVKSWPDAGGVPRKYLPSTVEFPLEHHDTWTDNLGRLCAEVAELGVPYGGRSTDPLRYRLLTGAELRADNDEITPLVHLAEHKRWTPGQPVDVTCDARAEDIIERVERWMNDPGGSFKRFLDEGLAAYLAENDPDTDRRRTDHVERLQRFRSQLGAAKNRSEPLVSIDADLYGQCHEKAIELTTICSRFPFLEGHPAAEDALKIVGEDAYEPGNADTTSVLISQYLKHPIHPLVVRSITDPISDALSATEDPGERSSSFWMWRRGRRLDAFVPLPRELLESVIRGFAVARLCGYVTTDTEIPMQITTEHGVAFFPWPLLSRLSAQNDIVPVLLESFSLTYGMVPSDGFRTYDGFKRLYDLGEPVTQGRIHAELEHLLETGSPPFPTVASEQPKVRGSNPTERRESALKYLEANDGWFWDQKTKRNEGKIFHKGRDGRADEGVPTMELVELLGKCYSELHMLLKAGSERGSVV